MWWLAGGCPWGGVGCLCGDKQVVLVRGGLVDAARGGCGPSRWQGQLRIQSQDIA